MSWLRRTVLCAGAVLISRAAAAQPSYCENPSSRKTARVAAASAAVAGNAALYVYFKHVWWSGEKAEHFTFNTDWDQEFRDQDKLGHGLGGYHLTRIGRELLHAGCVDDPQAAWLAFAYSFAFQFQIEMWDATQKKYGFSPGDLLFNTLGASASMAQYYHPRLLAFKPTISYAPTAAMQACRKDETTCGEIRGTLDYSGQTYWISADVKQLLPQDATRYWPGFLRVSAGHSVTDWILPPNTTDCPQTFQCVRRAKRKLVLSLDIDPEKLPGNHPLWKRVKHELSYLHVPGPALILTPDVRATAWYR